jgi:hypothetical protein
MSKRIDEVMEDQASHFEAILEAAKNMSANLPWVEALEIARNNGGNFEAAAVWLITKIPGLLPVLGDFQKRTEDEALTSIAELETGEGV